MVQTTEGVKLSDLDPLPNGPQPNDLIETSTKRVTDPDRYESRHSPAASVTTPPATTEIIGSMLLATPDEAGSEATNIVVTSEGLAKVIIDALKYAIEGTDGVTCSYNDGTGILTISAATACGNTNVIHVADSGVGDYGYNEYVTDAIFNSTFGSITPDYVANGGGTTLHIGSLGTSDSSLWFLMEAVLPQDWFSDIHAGGLNGGAPLVSADADSYFITTLSLHQYTVWSWTLADIGDWASLGDRNVGVCYNPIYQQSPDSVQFSVNPNSAYAFYGFPVSDSSLDTNAYTAMGGKINISSGYASYLHPTASPSDPAIYRGHCGIGAMSLTSGTDGDWFVLVLQNSTGSENYRVTSTCFPGGFLDTVDATYDKLNTDQTQWNEYAFAWPVTVTGWNSGATFTLTDLD